MTTRRNDGSIGPVSLVALATGGMVGGGIYVALGVVVEAAGRWAWLSFVIAGIIAVTTAHTYAALTNHFETDGGAFAFLEEIDRKGAAGSLSWVLLGAYGLTIALYGHAFGQYVAHAVGLAPPWPKLLAVVVLAGLTVLNLAGLAKMTSMEIAIVSANLLVLVGLAAFGIFARWAPEQLVAPGGPKPLWDVWMGAAAIFVSYEGFQLLTYEYGEVRRPKRILGPALVGSAIAVVVIYATVAVGAVMIIGAGPVIEQKSIALSIAARDVAGGPGLIVMTLAAAFATSAAINSTLFSSGQLMRRVSEDEELPAWFDHRNSRDVPDRAVVSLGVFAAVLTWVGSLGALVEAASLAFLAAFAAVHVIAWRSGVGRRWISGLALSTGAIVGAVLLYRLAATRPIALSFMLALFAASFLLRPRLLQATDQNGG